MFTNLIKTLKSRRGNSLAEFAVTTAMMATLATTAAPKFGQVGAGAKEKKTMANIDKILTVANNYYNQKLSEEGKGRFPGQSKYDAKVGGFDLPDGANTDEALETYLEEDYPDAMNANNKKIFTPSEVKDLDYYERQKYQILEGFKKAKPIAPGNWYEGARAYRITPVGARKLLDWVFANGAMPADWMLCDGIVDMKFDKHSKVTFKSGMSFTKDLQ